MVNREEAIKNVLEDLADEDLIKVYNRLAEKHHYEPIYPLWMMDELYSTEGKSVLDILDDLELVKYNDDYVTCDESNGYWTSFKYYCDSPNQCSTSELAKYIVEWDDTCDVSEIEDVFSYDTLDATFDLYFTSDDKVEIKGLGIKTMDEWYESLSADELDYLVSHVEHDEDNYIELM